VTTPGTSPLDAAVGLRIDRLAHHVEHVATLAHWHHAEWGALDPSLTIEAREERIRGRATPAGIPTAVVAFIDDQLVGSASLVEADMDSHPELSPWLASVFVSPAFRRRGVGSALVVEIERIAAQEGVETLWLWTPNQEQLYAQLGWTSVAQEPYRGGEATLMRKPILAGSGPGDYRVMAPQAIRSPAFPDGSVR
jgi:GNAT superfamily N-acetyltransferase